MGLDVQKDRFKFNKLRKRLSRQVGKAIGNFNLIEPDDKVLVCLSGAKDSYAMLDLLLALRCTAPINFDLVAVTQDQKQPDYLADILPNYMKNIDIPLYFLEEDTYKIVKSVIPEGKTTCSLCSRLRRGSLYGFAEKIGSTKIALGHHRNDMVETMVPNLFFGGKLKTMPTKLKSDSGRHIVIRPLAYCSEADLIDYASARKFPIIPCNLCGDQEILQRVQTKKMLESWELKYPGKTETIFRALSNVAPSHLTDKFLFDLNGLSIDENSALELSGIGIGNL